MPIIRAAQAAHFDLDGFHFLGFTSPSRGATELCTWQLDVDPGAASDAHRLNHEEVFIPLQGTLSVVLNGEEMELTAGDACAVPAQCLLQVANSSNETVRALVCVSADIKAIFADGREIGTPPWAK
ncbi:MAG: cupin domain-containing protein [Ktedonobacteraceae bacterium]